MPGWQLRSYRIHDARTAEAFTLDAPPTDIDRSVRLSVLRCLLTIFGIALVVSDIPRTGLTVSFRAVTPPVAPGTTMYYGPYNYPTIHLNRSVADNGAPGAVTGFRKGAPMPQAKVWAYKFDTVSVPQRALALHLGVQSYPPCVLYRGACPAELMAVETTFTMLDDLVTALQQRYFALEAGPTTRRRNQSTTERWPVVFKTLNHWVDRLHHVIIKWIYARTDERIHTAHHYDATARTMCPPHSRTRSFLCDLVVPWRCAHPVLGASKQVHAWQHVDLRRADLQRQYPNLTLDLTILTTRALVSSNRPPLLRTVFFVSDNFEITTWIRGRRCRPRTNHDGDPECVTVFIDDYRYERATIESDVDEWARVTGLLRGTAQIYIWLRLLLLWWGCFRTRSEELKYRKTSVLRRFLVAWLTFFKIPSHVMIYAGWFPVGLYSLAHLIDSGVTHHVSSNVWSTTDGLFKFQFGHYLSVATVQMRNVWLVALAWKTALHAYTVLMNPRTEPWTPAGGILGIRGVFLSAISSLTVFAFLRALRFRDTDIVRMELYPRHAPFNGLRFTPSFTNIAEYGYRNDLKTTTVATILLVVGCVLLEKLLRVLTQRPTRFFFCRSYYVPLSAGGLFPHSMLNIFWHLPLSRVRGRTSEDQSFVATWRKDSLVRACKDVSAKILEKTVMPVIPNHVQGCAVCNQPTSTLHWRRVQGCPRHEHTFTIESRRKEIWSMIRLINTGILSDPLTLVDVYVVGRPLYLYRLPIPQPVTTAIGSEETAPNNDANRRPTLGSAQSNFRSPPTWRHVLVPTPIHLSLEESLLLDPEVQTIDSHRRPPYDLVAILDSTTIPWGLLVGCG